jgi:protein-disulfide isomerase
VEYAAEVGLDENAFERCLRSDQFADVVSANYMLATQLRLSGTPTVIVNNRRIDNPTAANLRAVIEEALQATGPPR